MNRIELLKDFVMYCHDLKLDTTKKATKTKYIEAYMKNFVKYNGIKDFETKRKNIENILKYNPLTIEKLKKDYENNMKILPF